MILLDHRPPSAFHFSVIFSGSHGFDTSFQEVGGIGATIEVEKVPEGGQDDAVLPKGATYSNLVLKRGIVGLQSPLMRWCNLWANAWRTGKEADTKTKDVQVFLLDGNRLPLHCWSFAKAYPVKWNLGAFNAEENKVAVETIELTYQYFEWVY